jgi:hypothetical protein
VLHFKTLIKVLLVALLLVASDHAWAKKEPKVKISCFSEALTIAAGGGAMDATRLRQELKMAVDRVDADPILNDVIEAKIGFKPRDEVPVTPGSELPNTNVTTTDYWQVVVIPSIKDGVKRKMKIRERTYGYRAIGSEDPITYTNKFKVKDLDDPSKVVSFEYKIDHGEFEDTVYKPLLAMWRDDVALLRRSRSSFRKYRNEIRERAVNLTNKKGAKINDPKLVDQMLLFLGKSHGEIAKGTNRFEFPNGFQKTVTIEYERKAYEKILVDPLTKQEVKIQITRDQNIRYYLPDTRQELKNPYKPTEYVIEYKEPLSYALLSDDFIKDRFPELYEIRMQIKELQARRNQAIIGGKSSARELLDIEPTTMQDAVSP